LTRQPGNIAWAQHCAGKVPYRGRPDLYAIKFDPVFRDRDVASYVAGDIPGDILELMDLRAQVMNSCRGPLQRWLAARALHDKSPSEIAALIRSRMPKDVLAQQAKVAWADGLAFIGPVTLKWLHLLL
jgi:NAD(P)H dehydrogenase (quinone)